SAALHGGVVRDDHALLALDDADAGDDARAGRIAVVHVPGGQRGELEKRATRVDESVDPLAGGQLAAGAVALERLLAAAARDRGRAVAQLGAELLLAGAPRVEDVRFALERAGENRHGC